jgi:hypothetical protein
MTPGSFFFKISQLFYSKGVIILRRKMTPGHYSTGVISLHYTGIGGASTHDLQDAKL